MPALGAGAVPADSPDPRGYRSEMVSVPAGTFRMGSLIGAAFRIILDEGFGPRPPGTLMLNRIDSLQGILVVVLPEEGLSHRRSGPMRRRATDWIRT